MRRAAIVFFTFFCLLSQLAFAADVWFSPHSAGFNVDLSDYQTYSGTTGMPSWESAGYNETTLIGVVGFSGRYDDNCDSYDKIKIEVTFSSISGEKSSWMYVSASEPYLRRPFGVEFVAVLQDTNNDGAGGAAKEVERLGYQNDGSLADGDSSFTFEIGQYRNCWMDMNLVLPKDMGDSALSADDYYVTMTISLYYIDVTRTGSWPFYKYEEDAPEKKQSWTYSINGYISDQNEQNVASVFLNIAPNSNANALNVQMLADADENNAITIGNYIYETIAFTTDNEDEYSSIINNKYYIYASSPDGEPFALRLAGTDASADANDEYAKTVRFYYDVGLQSTKGRDSTVGAPITWFDGTTDSNSETSYLVPAKMREESMRGSSKSIVFEDAGEIVIKMSDKSKQNNEWSNLTEGVYHSTIYFNVVSDL